LPKRSYTPKRDLQLRILSALSDKPKTVSELKQELHVSDSSLFSALRPMIQGVARYSVGCDVRVDERGRIVHKYKPDPQRSRPILIKNPPFEVVYDKKNRRSGHRMLKSIGSGVRATRKQHIEGPRGHVRRGPIQWHDQNN